MGSCDRVATLPNSERLLIEAGLGGAQFSVVQCFSAIVENGSFSEIRLN